MIKVLQQHGIIPILIVLLTMQCVEGIPYTITSLMVTTYVLIITIIIYKVKYFAPDNKNDYLIVGIYFFWMLTAGAIRGIFVAENSSEFKDLIIGISSVTVPILVYAFSSSTLLWKTLHLWIWFTVPAFILFYVWRLHIGIYQLFFGPLFLICFIPILPNKWKIFLSAIILAMLVGDLGARSQSIKAAIVILICVSYYFRRWISVKLYSIVHWLCYIFPVIILYLAITGVFNPLEYMGESEDLAYDAGEEFLNADTRTLLYEETIWSAVKNDYIWFGRSLARGNDSWTFSFFTEEQLKTQKFERYGNEWCHPNIFTWMGVIGVLLFSFIYLKSSYLALYRSNNIWMKLLSMFIAFNWAWGWIENSVGIDILNVGIWIMVAMGFSEQFRAMSDKEIEEWVISLFKWKYEENIVA